MRRALLFFLLMFFFSAVTLSADQSPQLETAEQAMRAGDFATAIKQYQDILASGHENGHVSYHLGKLFYEKGDLGGAYLNLLRAALYLPRDAEVQAGLSAVRDRLADPFIGPWQTGIFGWCWQLFAPLSLLEFAWLAVMLALFFCGALSARLFWRRRWLNVLCLVLAVPLVLILLAADGRYASVHAPRALIKVDKTALKATFLNNSQTLAELGRGWQVLIVDQEAGLAGGQWAKVWIYPGVEGWVAQASLEPLQPWNSEKL